MVDSHSAIPALTADVRVTEQERHCGPGNQHSGSKEGHWQPIVLGDEAAYRRSDATAEYFA